MPILPGDIIDADSLVREVSDRVTTAAPNTISTTETIEETITLTIPTDWTQYAIEADMSCQLAETGVATGNTSITMRVRQTNASGTIWGSNIEVIGDGTAAANNSKAGLVKGFAEGETATGAVTVVMTMQASGNNGLISRVNTMFFARAVRTD